MTVELGMRASALAMSVMGVALLWPTPAAAQDRPAQDLPAMTRGRPVPALLGVWRSRGYGYVVRMAADGPTLFHVAGSFCYWDPRQERDPDNLFKLYRPRGPDTVAFYSDRGETEYVFDRLPDLPAACSDPTPWSRPRIVALVAATFAELYPSFELRGIDWRARTEAAERAIDENSDDAALFETLRTMLAGVEDPHVELHAEVAREPRSLDPGKGPTLTRIRAAFGDELLDDEEWLPDYRRGILSAVLQGKGQQRANKRLIWGRVRDIGYLNLLAMEGLSRGGAREDKAVLDAALDEAVAAFRGARAVIVDVSYNLGGYDGVSRLAAARFADARRLAYTKVPHGAQDLEPQPFHVEPSRRASYVGPVYLLTSDVTVSAGETFTLFMRALPNVVHVGGTTRGALSDQIEKPLPNGWTLALAAEIYRDPEGQWYEVRGIPPQLQREVFPPDDLTSGHARGVLALMDEIRKK
jgi:carboxyl-terminal processing protease